MARFALFCVLMVVFLTQAFAMSSKSPKMSTKTKSTKSGSKMSPKESPPPLECTLTCPDPDDDVNAWICEYMKWRVEFLVNWQETIMSYKNRYVTSTMDQFECNLLRLNCKQPKSLRVVTDMNNCRVHYCADGEYLGIPTAEEWIRDRNYWKKHEAQFNKVTAELETDKNVGECFSFPEAIEEEEEEMDSPKSEKSPSPKSPTKSTKMSTKEKSLKTEKSPKSPTKKSSKEKSTKEKSPKTEKSPKSPTKSTKKSSKGKSTKEKSPKTEKSPKSPTKSSKE